MVSIEDKKGGGAVVDMPLIPKSQCLMGRVPCVLGEMDIENA